MIETHTCIAVLCDLCGGDWYGDGVEHFASLDEARTALVTKRAPTDDTDPWTDDRWQIEDGKPVLCSTCLTEKRCAAAGHEWSEWYPGQTDLIMGRTCERCGRFETNIPLLVEQMTGEA